MSDGEPWLQPPQVDALRDACYSDGFKPSVRARNDAILALMYDTGLRPTEIVDVTTEMIHLDQSAIHLPSGVQNQHPTDTNPPPRTLELASDTVDTLREYLENRWKESLFLFPSQFSESLTTRGLREMITNVAIDADVEPHTTDGPTLPKNVTPYVLRHSLAYRMLAIRGADMTAVQSRLRHSRLSTTETLYGHFQSG